MYISKLKAGYSLVEVLVAISILLLALVGPMTIASKGMQSAKYAREQTTAIFLAQEGIEAFTQARNEATLVAFADDKLSESWDWVTDGTLPGTCLSAVGCNIDFEDADSMGRAVRCTTQENCRLYYDETKTRAKYSLDTDGASTPYQRVIKITEIPGGKGIEVASTVFWDTSLFTNQQSITLTSALFSLYE